jgi:hypothetical protein
MEVQAPQVFLFQNRIYRLKHFMVGNLVRTINLNGVEVLATYYSLQVQNMNYSMALSNTSTGIAGQYYTTVKQQYD